ncbi:uncharacterized protein DEA37_0013353 [Paragonimus westermani]|uniref:NTR domain-containing protein n=2 Tax=Paragonimus westermani TaxID=34504 RepID=A0A5J4NBB4_9TREM|nr:uncharacterized protein DEA37_0013353 [Paragonimus westermani]
MNDNGDFERHLEDKSSELVPVWVRLNELRCKCPEMELGINYLVVTDFESHLHNGRQELLFTIKTALLPWRPSWRRRLVRFHRRQLRGACDRFVDVAKLNDDDGGFLEIRLPDRVVQTYQKTQKILSSTIGLRMPRCCKQLWKPSFLSQSSKFFTVK